MFNQSSLTAKKAQKNSDKSSHIRGFSLVELMIVIILIAILVAVSIPELIQSRRLWQFAGMRQQIVASLREARQLAMSQNRRITLRYNDVDKTLRIYDAGANPPAGGVGPINDPRNKIVNLATNGVQLNDIVYGAPPGPPTPAPTTLSDTTVFSCTTPGPPQMCPGDIVDITFNARGDSIDTSICSDPPTCNISPPANRAMFFYNSNGNSAAFAVSILGPGGRVRVWAYNGSTNVYE